MNVSEALAANAVWKKDKAALRLALEALKGLTECFNCANRGPCEEHERQARAAIEAVEERILST